MLNKINDCTINDIDIITITLLAMPELDAPICNAYLSKIMTYQSTVQYSLIYGLHKQTLFKTIFSHTNIYLSTSHISTLLSRYCGETILQIYIDTGKRFNLEQTTLIFTQSTAYVNPTEFINKNDAFEINSSILEIACAKNFHDFVLRQLTKTPHLFT